MGLSIPLPRAEHGIKLKERTKEMAEVGAEEPVCPAVGRIYSINPPGENKQGAFQAIVLLYGKVLSLAGQLSSLVCMHALPTHKDTCKHVCMHAWQDYNGFNVISFSNYDRVALTI